MTLPIPAAVFYVIECFFAETGWFTRITGYSASYHLTHRFCIVSSPMNTNIMFLPLGNLDIHDLPLDIITGDASHSTRSREVYFLLP
jgi:hypothetical protein